MMIMTMQIPVAITRVPVITAQIPVIIMQIPDDNADSEHEDIAIFMTDVWHNVTADTVEIMLTNSENTASGNS